MIDWILQLRDNPCVQNDIIVRWDIGRRNQFIIVYGYKRQKWIAYVLYQRHESIKTNLHSINQKPRHIASTKKQSTEHQPNNSAHSIRLFLLVSLVRKLILFPTTQTTLSFCSRRRRRIHHPKNNLALRERGRQTVGEGGEEHFPLPPSALTCLLPRRRFLR